MQAIIVRHVFSFIFSLLLGYYLIPLIIKAAYRLHLLDQPDGKIKVHQAPVPYLGGLAVYGALIATLALAYPFENIILWLLLGSTLLLFIGLVDDLKVLKPRQKFFGQLLAVLCFLKGGFSLKTTFLSSGLNLCMSGFWMLLVINAFNLVDVMDGLSSLIALIAAITFFIIALIFKQYAISLLLAAFIGAIFAFFMHNKPPAKIYFGDAGALFVGGFLSAIPLLLSWSSQSFDTYYTPLIVLSIPLLEVFFLVIIRTKMGIPFYRGSPHHFSIYLQKKGWSRWKVLAFTGLMGIIASGTSILFLLQIISFFTLVVLGIFFIATWCAVVFYRPAQKIQTAKHGARKVDMPMHAGVGLSAKKR